MELTKEYCILTDDDAKLPPRRSSQNSMRSHKNPQIAVVHKANSCSTSATIMNNITITATNDANNDDLQNSDHINDNKKPSTALTTSNEQHENASKTANARNTAIEYG